MVHPYCNMFEVMPVIFIYCMINIVRVVGEIKKKLNSSIQKIHGMGSFKMLIHLLCLHPIVLYEEVLSQNIQFACMQNVFLYYIIIYINIIIIITFSLPKHVITCLGHLQLILVSGWCFLLIIPLYSISLYTCPAEHRTHSWNLQICSQNCINYVCYITYCMLEQVFGITSFSLLVVLDTWWTDYWNPFKLLT
jgi:hypothetical protein